jgi:hypothetical protein
MSATSGTRLISIALLFCAAALAQPPDAVQGPYIERGKIDLAVSGNFFVPHGYPGSTGGGAVLNAGYYVSRTSLVGGAFWFSGAADGPQFYALGIRYRRLFQTGSPRLIPFVGGSPVLIVRRPAATTNEKFGLRGEVGLKCFVAQNVSIEAAYNFQYDRAASNSYVRNSSQSRIIFGFALTL